MVQKVREQKIQQRASEFKSDASEAATHAASAAKEGAAYVTEAVKGNIVDPAKKVGQKAGSIVTDNIATATEYLSENVVDATEYIKDRAEDGKEYVKERAEDAKAYVKGKAEGAKEYVDETVEDAKGYAHKRAKEVKKEGKHVKGLLRNLGDQYYNIFVSPVSYRLSDSYRSAARTWNKFHSSLYRPAKSYNEKSTEEYLEKLKGFFDKDAIENEPKLKEAFDYILNSAHSAKNSAGEALSEAKDKITDTLKDGYENVAQTGEQTKDYWNSISNSITESLSLKTSPRGYWRNIYQSIEDQNNPIAAPISTLGYAPAPITSFYLGLMTILYTMTLLKKWTWAYGSLLIKETVKDGNGTVYAEKKTEIKDVHPSSTSELQRFEQPYWIVAVFGNLLLLELNDYSNLIVQLFFILTVGFSVLSSFVHPSYSQWVTYTPYYGLLIASALNIFTGLFQVPLL
ncbi:hypothetical protein K502DRAFT_365857 [Neoconidiobolus thromboides FSU 785]|nr:hypothetical protein K502DRAFT_365857 [Neoconidiobolus thromboides FSU 785]